MSSIKCVLVGVVTTLAVLGDDAGSLADDAQPAETLRRLSRQVEAVRKLPPNNRRVAEARKEIHRVLKTKAGREILERSLMLLLQLPPLRKHAPEAPSFPFSAKKAAAYQQAYADWRGLPAEVTNREGITLVLVPPGRFLMGSPESEPGHRKTPYDETQHPVQLTRPFYLGKHEITVGQFRRFVKSERYKTDGEKNGGGHAHDAKAVWKHRAGTSWRKPGYAGPFKMCDNHPVVHVSHADATAYCRWLEKRASILRTPKHDLPVYGLPTEAEWEWAARAGSGSRYWWGNAVDKSGKVINVGDKTLKRVHPDWPREIMPMDDGHAFPAPVGSYRANPFGLHDMLGNVWEFCSTRYGKFPKTLTVDPGDLEPKRGFAVRGGGWSNKPEDARCATRNADPPHFCHSNLGLRVTLRFPPPSPPPRWPWD